MSPCRQLVDERNKGHATCHLAIWRRGKPTHCCITPTEAASIQVNSSSD
jgi:hypothetical protein